jgi:hypothetical protein
VTPSPVAEADGRSILTSVEALEPTIDSALKAIVARKAAFTALPIGGIPALVKQDLSNLSASTAAFETALINSAPVRTVSTYAFIHCTEQKLYRLILRLRPPRSRAESMLHLPPPSLLTLEDWISFLYLRY